MQPGRKDTKIITPHGGYRGLKSYQTTEIIYDATIVFCDRFINIRSRTHDQMVQAARSGKQNIAEGSMASGTSKKTELKLVGVARASLEELLLDYQDFLRQRGLKLWEKNNPRAQRIRKLAYANNRSYSTYRTYINDSSPEIAANTLICLVHQANYLLDQQLRQLEKQFTEEGGFTERLYRARQRVKRNNINKFASCLPAGRKRTYLDNNRTPIGANRPSMAGGSRLRVISASRRVDMAAGYPDLMAEKLAEKCPPAATHTIVIWTKKPHNLFVHKRLNRTIKKYKQLFILYSITGLGGTALEPNAPRMEEALSAMPELINLAGDPRRIKIRFDPIIHLRSNNGRRHTNIGMFERVAGAAAEHGIRDIIISWMAPYKKVVAHLRHKEFEIEGLHPDRIQEEYTALQGMANRLNVRLHACCVDGLPRSSCIDGFLLNDLHPDALACSTRKAKGQREGCGCTESWDIGWYLPCPVGCLYCYANPAL